MFGRLATGPAREPELRTSRPIKLETLRSLLSTSEEMTLPQVRALLLLSTRGAQTVKSLAEGLSSHEFTIDRLCTRLVTRGLLVRVPAAANPDEFVIALSTAGRRIIEDAIYRQAREQTSPRAEAERRMPKMNAHVAQEER
jgi:DNA-binding MarR family transcriptional regulator